MTGNRTREAKAIALAGKEAGEVKEDAENGGSNISMTTTKAQTPRQTVIVTTKLQASGKLQGPATFPDIVEARKQRGITEGERRGSSKEVG